MKKTLITLLILAGTVSATEYTYNPTEEGWVETNTNWVDADGNAASGGFTETNGHTFNINNGQLVKAGNNTTLNGGTFNISGTGSTLQLQHSGKTYTPTSVNVSNSGKFDVTASTTLGTSANKANVTITNGTLSVAGTVTNANVALNGAEVNVTGSGALTINKAITSTTINVDSTASLTIGDNVKMKNVELTTSATVTVGGTTYWDNNPSNGPITFNLGDTGKVAYNNILYKSAGTTNQPGWVGSLTLNANCSEGFLEGSALKLMTRDLVTFSSIANNADYGDLDGFLKNYISGDTITLNGKDLEFSEAAFNAGSLTADDVGKYNFAITNNAIQLQYVAYSSNIPEPATATLSLLALAGLAARRRRR